MSSCSVHTGYQKNRFQNVLKVFTVSDENYHISYLTKSVSKKLYLNQEKYCFIFFHSIAMSVRYRASFSFLWSVHIMLRSTRRSTRRTIVLPSDQVQQAYVKPCDKYLHPVHYTTYRHSFIQYRQCTSTLTKCTTVIAATPFMPLWLQTDIYCHEQID